MAIFSAFGLYIFETFTDKANAIIQWYVLPIEFPLNPKYVTLNNTKWPFYVKFCFDAGSLRTSNVGDRDYRKHCVKTTKDNTHTVSGKNVQQGSLVSDNIRLVYMDIRAVFAGGFPG